MRGSLAYALIFLILLNMGGYHVLFTFIQYKNSKHIITKLDEESFHPDETLLVKVPLTIPYATDSKDFERVDGTFEYNGEIYQLVKQKLYKDTLHVVVLKDAIGSKINKAKADFASSLTDQPGSKDTNHNTKIFKNLIKDYIGNTISVVTVDIGLIQNIYLSNIFNFYTNNNVIPINIPPELS